MESNVFRIYINKAAINPNIESPDPKPVINVDKYNREQGTVDRKECNHVTLLDKNGNPCCEIVYTKRGPTHNGAHIWVETKYPVICDKEGIR